VPTGVLTFSRKVLEEEEIPDFKNSTKTFTSVNICLDGTIEDCKGALQVMSAF
jgi:hypothetical protein